MVYANTAGVTTKKPKILDFGIVQILPVHAVCGSTNTVRSRAANEESLLKGAYNVRIIQ